MVQMEKLKENSDLLLSWKKAGHSLLCQSLPPFQSRDMLEPTILCLTAWLHPLWTCLSSRSLSRPKTTVICGNVSHVLHIHAQAHTLTSKESSQIQPAVCALLVKQTEILLNALPARLGKSSRNAEEDWKHLLSPTGQEKGIKMRIFSNKKVK